MRVLIIGPQEAGDKLARFFERAQVVDKLKYSVTRVFDEVGISGLKRYLENPHRGEIDAAIFLASTLSDIEPCLKMLRNGFEGIILLVSSRTWSLEDKTVKNWGASDWFVDIGYTHQSEKIDKLMSAHLSKKTKVPEVVAKTAAPVLGEHQLAQFTEILEKTLTGKTDETTKQVPLIAPVLTQEVTTTLSRVPDNKPSETKKDHPPKKSSRIIPFQIPMFMSGRHLQGKLIKLRGHSIELTLLEHAIFTAIQEGPHPISRGTIKERCHLSSADYVRVYVLQIQAKLNRTEKGLGQVIKSFSHGTWYEYTPPELIN